MTPAEYPLFDADETKWLLGDAEVLLGGVDESLFQIRRSKLHLTA